MSVKTILSQNEESHLLRKPFTTTYKKKMTGSFRWAARIPYVRKIPISADFT